MSRFDLYMGWFMTGLFLGPILRGVIEENWDIIAFYVVPLMWLDAHHSYGSRQYRWERDVQQRRN